MRLLRESTTAPLSSLSPETLDGSSSSSSSGESSSESSGGDSCEDDGSSSRRALATEQIPTKKRAAKKGAASMTAVRFRGGWTPEIGKHHDKAPVRSFLPTTGVRMKKKKKKTTKTTKPPAPAPEVTAPVLPGDWEAVASAEHGGQSYYRSATGRRSTWTVPNAAAFAALVVKEPELPSGWEQVHSDEHNAPYYKSQRRTTWTRPSLPAEFLAEVQEAEVESESEPELELEAESASEDHHHHHHHHHHHTHVWNQLTTEDGTPYYFCEETGKSSWHSPDSPAFEFGGEDAEWLLDEQQLDGHIRAPGQDTASANVSEKFEFGGEDAEWLLDEQPDGHIRAPGQDTASANVPEDFEFGGEEAEWLAKKCTPQNSERPKRTPPVASESPDMKFPAGVVPPRRSMIPPPPPPPAARAPPRERPKKAVQSGVYVEKMFAPPPDLTFAERIRGALSKGGSQTKTRSKTTITLRKPTFKIASPFSGRKSRSKQQRQRAKTAF